MIESLWNLQNKSLALAKHTNRQIFPSSTRQQHRDSITQFGLLLLRQRMSPLQNELKKKKSSSESSWNTHVLFSGLLFG